MGFTRGKKSFVKKCSATLQLYMLVMWFTKRPSVCTNNEVQTSDLKRRNTGLFTRIHRQKTAKSRAKHNEVGRGSQMLMCMKRIYPETKNNQLEQASRKLKFHALYPYVFHSYIKNMQVINI
jgi:hypothetical protein